MKRNSWNRLAIFVIAVAAMACSRPARAQDALRILTRTPAGAAGSIGQTLAITVTFNQPMVALTALPEGDGSGPLAITPPVKGKYRWNGTATVVFTPRDTLTFATEYRVSVPAGTRSLSGAVLSKEEVWSFETPRPQLTYSAPSPGSSQVNLTQVIYLYFNQPMDAVKARPYVKAYAYDRNKMKIPLGMVLNSPSRDERKRRGLGENVLTLASTKAISSGSDFVPSDFTEPFWRLMRNPADSVSTFLFAQFPRPVQQLLAEHDQRMPADQKLKDAVTGEINRIMKSSALYSATRFAHVPLNQGTRALAGQKLSRDNLARLNRLLLIKAFDEYLDRVGRMPQEASIRVELAKGLPAAAGALGLAEQRMIEFSTYNYFRFIGAGQEPDRNPSSPVVFEFSNPVYGADLLKGIVITPRVSLYGKKESDGEEGDDEGDYYYRHSGARQSLRFQFKPETQYNIAISGRLRDMYGQALGTDAAITVRTAGYNAAVHIPGGVGVLEAYLPARLPVAAMNWRRLQRRFANVPPDEIVPLLRDGINEKSPVAGWPGAVNDEWDLQTTRNVLKRLPLDLKPVLNPDNTGLVYYNLYGLPPREFTYDRWVDTTQLRSVSGFAQVTNLGLTGKYSPDNILIWVTRLKDCQPVSGAQVELRGDNNKILYTGKSDKNGLCQCPGWYKLGIQPPQEDDGEYYYGQRPRVWAIVSKGADRAVLVSRWGMGIEPYEFGLPYDWNPQPVQYQGYLFTERGLYKAGEKVYLKGIFRQKRRGQWEIPSRRAMTLVIKDSRDQELVNKKISLSDWGSFGYMLQLKSGAPTGYYSATVESDSISRLRAGETFRVEAYKPAKFEVSVKPGSESYIAGDSLAGTVSAKYLFGAPMSREKFSWAARLSPHGFSPPGHDGFIFSRYWWWDESRDYGSLLASGEGELSEQGSAGIGAKLDLRGSKSTMALTVEATVTSKDRTTMSGRRQAVVHRGAYYIGYRQSASFIDVGKELTLSVIGARPDGSLAPSQAVAVEIIRQQWISARRAGSGGRYEWYSERKDSTVLSASVKTGQVPATVAYTPGRPGFYIFRLKAVDSRGNQIANGGYFYAIGAGYVSWESRNDDRIDLVADKESYAPGDRARIMVKSPYPSCKALVTVEREFVLSQQVVDLAGSAPVIELPILPEHLPNVYVSVILLRGRLDDLKYAEDGNDLSKPAFKIGYVNLAVDPGTKRLALAIASDKPNYLPRDSVSLELTARDFQNQPAEAEVTLAVVDKGVLNLIDFRTPDAFNAFYGARPLSVETAETRLHVIGQRNYGEKGENRGGGGGPDAGFRGEFLTTPFYSAAVYTDKDGRAQARFRLPDNLTAFKIMATAHTKGSQFGAADNSFTVSKPVLLLESLPRFLRIGDSLTAGVTVHNRTGRDQQVEIKATVTGAELLGSGTKTVTVKPDQPAEVTFSYRARIIGEAVFRFAARAEGGSDGLEQKITVLMPKITETVALYEQTENTASQALTVPANVWPGIGSLQVTTSSTAFVGLEGCLDYLIKYPYGCLEQTMSGLMPMILAHDLIVNFNLAPAKGKDIRTYVQAGIERVYKFQGADGAFGLWLDSRFRDPYLTAYVLWGLHRAKQKGYEVDNAVVDKGIVYLRSSLGRIGEINRINWPYSRRWKYNTMAYGAYALALWGKPDQIGLTALCAQRDSMNLFGRSLLLRALYQAKLRPETQAELTQQLFNTVKVAPTTWHFEDAGDESDCWVFYSNVVSTSFILSTLLETKGEFAGAEKIVNWLMEERKTGRWRSTHENMRVFTAMDDYLNVYEKDNPDFTASIKLAGREILSETFKGRELTARTKSFGLSEFAPGKQLPVKIEKQGAGRLYYGLRMSYAPLAPVKYRDEGFAVAKRITTATGDTLVTSFTAGKIYKVTLTVTTKQDRHYVVVDDPLPAGFEPVNMGFATESDELRRQSGRDRNNEDGEGDYEGGWGWWWGGFNHIETYDDRVLCFADVLSNGTHTHSYYMRALTPGRYAVPQTKAEEMYSPEVFGWIPDTVVEVK